MNSTKTTQAPGGDTKMGNELKQPAQNTYYICDSLIQDLLMLSQPKTIAEDTCAKC